MTSVSTHVGCEACCYPTFPLYIDGDFYGNLSLSLVQDFRMFLIWLHAGRHLITIGFELYSKDDL